MTKPIFVGINSRYNHTNLAIRSIAAYCQKPVHILEATIAEYPTQILRSIFEALELDKNKSNQEQASQAQSNQEQLIIFSVYIWNALLVYELAQELKKILPKAIIGFGGPEVSYQAEKVFAENPSLDFIVKGEGEETVKELVAVFYEAQNKSSAFNLDLLQNISGLYLRKKNLDSKNLETTNSKNTNNLKNTNNNLVLSEQNFIATGERELLCNLDSLPFAYPSLKNLIEANEKNLKEINAKENFANKIKDTQVFIDHVDPAIHIFYYESSRGCPFKCSYCLSSIEKKVRYRSLEKVFSDLAIFLNANVRLVKFVDRTFNLIEERYLAIWSYIISHHNGVTMFHFEIAAEQFSDRVLDFLQKMPRGIMQFEIGVQSLNPDTLKEIHRHADIEKLSKIISRIPSTIHSHLDLIAGLPHENIKSFASSFDQTIALKPDMLQLGFLKILSGTEMESYAKKCVGEKGYQWMEKPPYEVLQSPDLSYAELLFLKDIEESLDIFYNSGNFKTLCLYLLEKKYSLFHFFSVFVDYCQRKELFKVKHKTQGWAGIIAAFLDDLEKTSETEKLYEMKESLYELLRFDFMRLVKPGKIPSWYKRQYNKDAHHAALLAHTEIKSTRESYAYSDYDRFAINPFSFEIISDEQEKVAILFLYAKPQERTSGQTRSETDCIVLEK